MVFVIAENCCGRKKIHQSNPRLRITEVGVRVERDCYDPRPRWLEAIRLNIVDFKLNTSQTWTSVGLVVGLGANSRYTNFLSAHEMYSSRQNIGSNALSFEDTRCVFLLHRSLFER